MNIDSLVDLVLNCDDFASEIKCLDEAVKVRTKDEFLTALEPFDKQLQSKGAITDFEEKGESFKWTVEKADHGTDCVLSVKSFNDNGSVNCDRNCVFKTNNCANLNLLSNPDRILSYIDSFADAFKKEQMEPIEDPDEEKEDENEDPEEEFELDPAVDRIMDGLKTQGEYLLSRVKTVPAVVYGGKEYKIEDGEILASTEREAVLSLAFPRDKEIDIYANDVDGKVLRRAIVKAFNRAGFKGKQNPSFRMDMDKKPYFYIPIGKIPVKDPKGQEAKALLNYFDGKKVRFQPKND